MVRIAELIFLQHAKKEQAISQSKYWALKGVKSMLKALLRKRR